MIGGDDQAEDPNVLMHAYGRAAQAGDTEAMSDLHGRLLKAYQAQTPKATDEGNTFQEGIGRGLSKVADTITGGHFNLTNDDTDKALLDTKGGKWGNIVGETAATLPVGTLGGAAAGALGIGRLAGTGVAATLGRGAARAAQAGAEGAAGNALTGEDAGEGALGGIATQGVLGAGGKFLKGLVGKSEAAQRLYQDADQHGKDLFIPISQGGTGLTKSIYQKALPYALGVETQLGNQSKKAKDVMSEVATEEGMPVQVDKTGKQAVVPAPIGNTMEQTAANTRDLYDQAYQNTVKSYAFNKPQNFHADVQANLANSGLPKSDQASIADTLDSILERHSDGGSVLSGQSLLNAKNEAREALGNLRGPGGLYKIGNKASTEQAMGTFDDIVQDAIDDHKNMLGGKMAPKARQAAQETVRDLENYQRLAPAYGSGNAVASTAEANIPDRGELKFGKLATNAPENSPLRSMAQDAHEVLEKESPGSVNPAGRHFLHGGEAVAAALHPSLVPPMIVANAAGNLMATKPFQKGLYGDTGWQQYLARALRNNPKTAHLLSYSTRQGINDASGQ